MSSQSLSTRSIAILAALALLCRKSESYLNQVMAASTRSARRRPDPTFCPKPAFKPSSARNLPSSFMLQLSPGDIDAAFVGGSLLWGANCFLGLDWLLAPLGVGLDSDFNPATRMTTFIGKVLQGRSLDEALQGSQVLQDGERPEMGSRIGTGANVGYSVETLDELADDDWMAQRDAGLKASAPVLLQASVILLFGVIGVIIQTLTHSTLTAAVLVIPALVYEIGRPSFPTKEEAFLDAKIDTAVNSFVESSLLLYGDDAPEGVSSVKRDEATNERELVSAFRRKVQEKSLATLNGQEPLKNDEVSDFQIEMRMRSFGNGRSAGGYIKGIRLL